MAQATSPIISRLEVLAAAALFSTGGAAIKATTLTSWQVASFRSGIATLFLLLFLPAARRGWTRRSLLVGLTYAATLVFFILANKLTTAANAVFLQGTAPAYMFLLSPWILKEPARRSDILFLALIVIGMALFFAGDQAATPTAPNPPAGNLLGAASGFTWALTLTGLRSMERSRQGPESGIGTVALGNAAACLVTLPLALPASGAPTDWAVLAYLGIVQIGIAYALFTRGVRGVTAIEASLLVLAEPALSPVWAWLVHQERPANLAILGGLLILAATAGRTLRRT